jgi:hypothetical protein
LSVVTPQYNSSKYANDFCGFDRTSHAWKYNNFLQVIQQISYTCVA